MGGAKRYPSTSVRGMMGFASLYPSYDDIPSHSRGALRPRLHLGCPSYSEGAGKTGCLLHPRSHVRFALKKMHTSIQGSGSIPAFPAQWLYGLLRALPGERLFCLRRHERSFASPGLSASTAAPEPQDLTSMAFFPVISQVFRGQAPIGPSFIGLVKVALAETPHGSMVWTRIIQCKLLVLQNDLADVRIK
jgi:hypothetical protein